MASFHLAGRSWEVAPLRLRELRRAAPHIDRLAARASSPRGVTELADTAVDLLAILAAGLPDGVAAPSEAELSLDDVPALSAAVRAILAEAGLRPAVDALPGEDAGLGEGTGAAAP